MRCYFAIDDEQIYLGPYRNRYCTKKYSRITEKYFRNTFEYKKIYNNMDVIFYLETHYRHVPFQTDKDKIGTQNICFQECIEQS